MQRIVGIVAAAVLAASGMLAQAPAAAPAGQQASGQNPWFEPVEPFRIADDFYYVGTRGLSSFLFVTPQGHILLDATLAETEPLIEASIRKLGFSLRDIRSIVSSHAHYDHVAGLAPMQRATGAQVVALGEDAAAIASGKDNSALGGPGWEPVKVDRTIRDGDTVTLGPWTLTAHLTAGHTRGCTTWTTTLRSGGRSYPAVFVCSLSINAGVRLTDNTRHPGIAKAYTDSIQVLRGLDAQFWFGPHPNFFDLEAKRQRMGAGSVNPFIDPAGYRAYVDRADRTITEQLRREAATR